MLADKLYDINRNPSRVFQSDFKIKSKKYCRVFLDKVGEGDWNLLDENLYDLINDKIVFKEEPKGFYLVLQVATTPSELTSTPTENATILTISEEIKIVAGMQGDILEVSEFSYKWANNPEDVPVTNGEFSAYHWAKKAQRISEGEATAIKFNNSTTNLNAKNVQDALVEINVKADKVNITSLPASKITYDNKDTNFVSGNVQDVMKEIDVKFKENVDASTLQGYTANQLIGVAQMVEDASIPKFPVMISTKNVPVENLSYYVHTFWGEGSLNNQTFIQKAYRRSSPNEVYIRTKYAGTFSKWLRLVDTDTRASRTQHGVAKMWTEGSTLYISTKD